ncbi:MAG: MSCRAMM family adhesin SdrC [Eubacterium sp.]|nr:MSCRAMM family adhesin SdrC [Eubacterium sp.]
MSKHIEDNLMTAFEELAPDCFDEIMARIDADEATLSDDYIIEETPKKHSYRIFRYTLPPAAAAAVCAVAFGLNASADDSIGTIYIDVNPSISITYDKDGMVNDILAENEDGADLLEDIDVHQYKDTQLSDSVNMVLTQLNSDGYFEDSTADLIVSNCPKESDDDTSIDETINETITDYAKANSLDATWVSQSFEEDEDLTTAAKEEQVSVGKYYFLQHVTENTGVDVTGLKDESVKNIYAYLADAQIDLTQDDSITVMHVTPSEEASDETSEGDDTTSNSDNPDNSDSKPEDTTSSKSSDKADKVADDTTESDNLESDHEESNSIANPPKNSASSDNPTSSANKDSNTSSDSGNNTNSEQNSESTTNSNQESTTTLAITNTIARANGNISIRFSTSATYGKHYKAIVKDDEGNTVDTTIVKKTKHRLVLNADSLEDDTTYTVVLYGIKSDTQEKAERLSSTFTLEQAPENTSPKQATQSTTDSDSTVESEPDDDIESTELP